MLSKIKNFFYWDTQYSYTDYRKYTSWVSQQYSQLPEFHTLKGFCWNNKELIVGTVAVGLISIVAMTCLCKCRSHPQQKQLKAAAPQPNVSTFSPKSPSPTVTFFTTLNLGEFYINIPKGEPSPPNVSLTFCVDTSSSMKGVRETELKQAVKDVLDNAQGIIDHSKGATIEIAIIGFNNSASIISAPIKITPSDSKQRAVDKIIANLNRVASNGGTSITAGLKEATNQLEEMSRKNPNGSHTLILLTDGDENLDQGEVSAIHTRLKKAHASLFAVGIGKDHKQETLETIAPQNGNFKGKYINTASGKETITSAISGIYKHVIAAAHKVKLRSSHLEAGSWSVDRFLSIKGKKGSKFKLEPIVEETPKIGYIKIRCGKLKGLLELSSLSFDLILKNPKGEKRTISVPWKPNTIIDPKLVNDAKK